MRSLLMLSVLCTACQTRAGLLKRYHALGEMRLEAIALPTQQQRLPAQRFLLGGRPLDPWPADRAVEIATVTACGVAFRLRGFGSPHVWRRWSEAGEWTALDLGTSLEGVDLPYAAGGQLRVTEGAPADVPQLLLVVAGVSRGGPLGAGPVQVTLRSTSLPEVTMEIEHDRRGVVCSDTFELDLALSE